jgi:AcrR family transcriptional regulator
MPRPRRDELRQEFSNAIKDTARAHMRQNGTAGISLRAIARDLDVTAPAIYNYFARLDDLITALIVDAFNALGETMETASQAAASAGLRAQFRAALLAYRAYAVANPTDFELIYGNPIPGYTAPAEITVPLASRPLLLLLDLALQIMPDGFTVTPREFEPPAAVLAYFAGWKPQAGLAHVPDDLLYTMLVGWSRIHGVVMLELFEHLPPTVGDAAALYAQQVDYMISLFDPP